MLIKGCIAVDLAGSGKRKFGMGNFFLCFVVIGLPAFLPEAIGDNPPESLPIPSTGLLNVPYPKFYRKNGNRRRGVFFGKYLGLSGFVRVFAKPLPNCAGRHA